jgi:hypothetical protein
MHDAAILTGGYAPAHEPGAYPSLSCCGGPVVLVPTDRIAALRAALAQPKARK